MKSQLEQRRYDIDWLRVIAIGLLIIYHCSLGFQPWGIYILFIQNAESLESIWVVMSMINTWRIPLLFFISGMGVAFAMRKRNTKALILERTKRIFIPFVFGITVIVPIHIALWQNYYNQEVQYIVKQGHLWFLANIFAYVVLLSICLHAFKKLNTFQFASSRIYKSIGGLYLISIPFIISLLVLNPDIYEMYTLSFHGFAFGLISFVFGYSFIVSGEYFWNNVNKFRWIYLVIAMSLFLIRYLVFQFNVIHYFKVFEMLSWIFTLFGFANKYLNKPSHLLSKLSNAAYPIYIIHMIFLYLSSSIVFEMSINPFVKFFIVITSTTLGSYISYEFIIKKLKAIGFLFGTKTDFNIPIFNRLQTKLSISR